MTLDAAKWNCAGGDLSSCVTNIILLDHVSYFTEHIWNKFTRLFILSCFMYMFMFRMYSGLHAYRIYSAISHTFLLKNRLQNRL